MMKKLIFLVMCLMFFVRCSAQLIRTYNYGLNLPVYELNGVRLTSTFTQLNSLNTISGNVQSLLNGKQATLVSGTNIKFINGNDLMGMGNLVIGTGGTMVYPGTGIPVVIGGVWGTSITNNSGNWNTAYTDCLKWDGGATGLTPATGRTSLGGTTVGSAFFTLTNPSAITFPRINADNSVSALSAANFKTTLSLDQVTNESKATIFTSPHFTGSYAFIGTDTADTRAYARSVGGGTGNATAVNVRVDSIVKVLKDSLSLSSVAVITADSLTNKYATKKYARDNGGGGSTIPVLSANPSSGNAYINSVDKKLHYLSGGYWHRVAILDSTAATAGASTLLNGLVGYWKFDETSGTNLADATAGSHNATLGSGTVNQTGKIGKAVTYNNTGYATIPYAAFSSITDKETISFWFYPTSLPSTVTRNEWLFTHEIAGTDETSRVLWNTDGKIYAIFDNTSDVNYQVNSAAAITTLNVWYHVVAVCPGNGQTLKLYINNVDVSTSAGTFSGTLKVSTAVSTIANDDPIDIYGLVGTLDELGIWKRALPALGVDSLYVKVNAGTSYPW
jgi:hypothetical protein